MFGILKKTLYLHPSNNANIMQSNLTGIIKANRSDSFYQAAAKRFNTSYGYVIQIARGERQALRGKGRAIREWMERSLNQKQNTMKRNRISLRDFSFMPAGHGRYLVTYTSPATGKEWTATITDMTLIDATKNSPDPKAKDLEWLKYYCKQG